MNKTKGAGIILLNSNNQVLLILRDNKLGIPFPDMWDIPGGHVEPGENPVDTIKREMMEEMNLELDKIEFFKKYERNNLTDCIFWSRMNLDVNKIKLNEGQKVQYFSRQEINDLNLAFNYNEVLEEFFDFIES